ncbi:hypothetical protein GCK32_004062 [Trichostrongylus colubriformis]|uniref:Uncharacterized protein n=1 Tax=Trichostrongylus colubriformis TaxID=6319 RepID=A0AAN8IPG1_TRICO
MLLRRLFVTQWQAARSFCVSSNTTIDERYDALLNETFSKDETAPEHWTKQSSGVARVHDFMVIHPKVRWGSSSPSVLKDPQRQLDEAVTLVNTLPGFRVVESTILGVDYNTKRKRVWGPGQLEALASMKQQSRVTALMVNVDMLSPLQQSTSSDRQLS